MASDESLTMVSSSILDEDFEDMDDGFHQTQHNSLSRLSICSRSVNDDEDDDLSTIKSSQMGIFMSGLSLESFDGAEADGEVSDDDKGRGKADGNSDSDKEPGFYSLPTTSSRRRRKIPAIDGLATCEDERKKDGSRWNSLRRQRKGGRERNPSWMVKESVMSTEGDSDGGGGGGLVVITRPKGGKRCLRMDLGEVKACRDLGFELEHERMIEVVPGRGSVSTGSNLETPTSSGGNSPIGNWRISSPGDDRREVKARLKMWAQAVALASASRHAS